MRTRWWILAVAGAVIWLAPGAGVLAEPLDLEGLRGLEDVAPANPDAAPGAMKVYPSSLRLVGMSPKGALATLQHHDDDVLPVWTLQVVSLVSDEVLVQRRWEDPEGETSYGDLVDAHGAEILSDLEAQGVGGEPLELAPFPLTGAAGEFLLDLAEDGVFLASPTLATKQIASVKAEGDEAEVLGYVASHHERRIAVVLRVREPGFEGTTNTRFQVAGAHLDTGFTDDSERLRATPRFQAFVKAQEAAGLFAEDAILPRLGAPAESTLAEYVPAAATGATARFGTTVRERESIGGGLYREVRLEEWQYASARQATAAYEALIAGQGSQSDTMPMWKTPHSFAVEGRYVYRLVTRAHAFIPVWREVIGRLEEDLAAN